MKIFILSFFLVLCSLLYSQGNLQFNQVLTYSQNFNLVGCGSNQCSWTGPTYTVPAGKVWKIEYFVSGGQGDIVITLNSTVNVASTNGSPVWLKPTDLIQVKKLCGIGASCNLQSGSFFISIIEFNVVP
jgi:hypothetical protein